jgi:hypothetical protein
MARSGTKPLQRTLLPENTALADRYTVRFAAELSSSPKSTGCVIVVSAAEEQDLTTRHD